ncbi:MAG: hypothetical protein P8X90_31110 [Desulfobacterales bacterium]
MRWRFILNIIGILTFFFGLTMVFPLMFGLYYQDSSVIPLLQSMGITALAGLILYSVFRKHRVEVINQREDEPPTAAIAAGVVVLAAKGLGHAAGRNAERLHHERPKRERQDQRDEDPLQRRDHTLDGRAAPEVRILRR